MAYNLIIVDNFYSNPIEVRDFALSQDFDVKGNYPGQRTKSFLSPSLKEYIELHMSAVHGKINWPKEGEEEYCGSFQFTTAEDRTWIHSDNNTKWAGVLYLTPDAPVSSGTGLYKHKETGLCGWDNSKYTEEETSLAPHMSEARDYTKWDLVDRLGNKFNRLVLYRSDNYHVSMDYFGKDKYDGRLFQVFFFTTEY